MSSTRFKIKQFRFVSYRFFPNHERDKIGRGWGNTYQTYIWIESKLQRNERNELMWKKVINMNLLYK